MEYLERLNDVLTKERRTLLREMNESKAKAAVVMGGVGVSGEGGVGGGGAGEHRHHPVDHRQQHHHHLDRHHLEQLALELRLERTKSADLACQLRSTRQATDDDRAHIHVLVSTIERLRRGAVIMAGHHGDVEDGGGGNGGGGGDDDDADDDDNNASGDPLRDQRDLRTERSEHHHQHRADMVDTVDMSMQQRLDMVNSIHHRLDAACIERNAARLERDAYQRELHHVRAFVDRARADVRDLELVHESETTAMSATTVELPLPAAAESQELATPFDPDHSDDHQDHPYPSDHHTAAALTAIFTACTANIGRLRQRVGELEMIHQVSLHNNDYDHHLQDRRSLHDQIELATTKQLAHPPLDAAALQERDKQIVALQGHVAQLQGQIGQLQAKLQPLEEMGGHGDNGNDDDNNNDNKMMSTLLAQSSAVEALVRTLEDQPSLVDAPLVGSVVVDDGSRSVADEGSVVGRLLAVLMRHQRAHQRDHEALVVGTDDRHRLVDEEWAAFSQQQVEEQAEALSDVTAQWRRACDAVHTKNGEIEVLGKRLKEALDRCTSAEGQQHKVQLALGREKKLVTELQADAARTLDDQRKLRETMASDRESAAATLDMLESLLNDERERSSQLCQTVAAIQHQASAAVAPSKEEEALARALEQQRQDRMAAVQQQHLEQQRQWEQQLDASRDQCRALERELAALLDSFQVQELELATTRDATEAVYQLLRDVLLTGLPAVAVDLTASEIRDMDPVRLMDRFRSEIHAVILEQRRLRYRLHDVLPGEMGQASQPPPQLPLPLLPLPLSLDQHRTDQDRTMEQQQHQQHQQQQQQYERMISLMQQQLRDAESKLADLGRKWAEERRAYGVEQADRELRIVQLESVSMQSDARTAVELSVQPPTHVYTHTDNNNDFGGDEQALLQQQQQQQQAKLTATGHQAELDVLHGRIRSLETSLEKAQQTIDLLHQDSQRRATLEAQSKLERSNLLVKLETATTSRNPTVISDVNPSQK